MFRPKQLLVAFVAGFALLCTTATASARSLTSPEALLLRAMNTVRRSHDLGRLRVDYRLERAAQGHSSDMLRHQYFAHTSFGARMQTSGARGPVFGEDLAWGPANAQWVVSRWLASPKHRANLLRPGFRRVGLGALTGTFGGRVGALVVTADFAGF
jgi:uncharacterized protein YkwD